MFAYVCVILCMCVCLGPLTIDTMVQHVRELNADVRMKRKPSNRESMETTGRSKDVWGTGREDDR